MSTGLDSGRGPSTVTATVTRFPRSVPVHAAVPLGGVYVAQRSPVRVTKVCVSPLRRLALSCQVATFVTRPFAAVSRLSDCGPVAPWSHW